MEEEQRRAGAAPPVKGWKKRGRPDECDGSAEFSFLSELNGDLLEKILSRLPPSSFFRLRSVCKRWLSASTSATFVASCSEVPSREPWFFMVDSDLRYSVVFDTSEGDWKNLNRPSLLPKSIPVASAGGLVCFRSPSGGLFVCNPVDGACSELPPPPPADAAADQRIHAIAMKSSPLGHSSPSYEVVLIAGDSANLAVKVYSSEISRWEEGSLSRKKKPAQEESEVSGEETVYFLSKAGEVVAADIQRSPFKKYSSVITTVGAGEELVYFLGPTGTVVACNLSRRVVAELPRLLPVNVEYSVDVVECMGEMMVVVLSELLEAASLRVWRFCRGDQSWRQVAAMPPSMSREWFGKRADINCAGFKEMIFICLSSGDLCRCVVCDIAAGEWRELPGFSVNGAPLEFMSAFSFEPRIEARV